MTTDAAVGYTIRPLNLETDVESYLAARSRAFKDDPMNSWIKSKSKSPEMKAAWLHYRTALLVNTIQNRGPKYQTTDSICTLIVDDATSSIVGGITWSFPSRRPVGAETLEPIPEYPSLDGVPESEKAVIDILSQLNAQWDAAIHAIPLLGPKWQENWWYLSSLAIVPEAGGKGLGTILTKQGIELARADSLARPEKRIKGAWVSSTDAGLKSYIRAGFKKIEQITLSWGSQEGAEEDGGKQDYHILAIEF